jgi:hypothetical protein
MSLSKTVFGCFDVGTNTVSLTVTDNNYGNSASALAVANVEDHVPPPHDIVLAHAVTAQLDVQGRASIEPDVDAGSSDACGTLYKHLTVSDLDCSDIGPILSL